MANQFVKSAHKSLLWNGPQEQKVLVRFFMFCSNTLSWKWVNTDGFRSSVLFLCPSLQWPTYSWKLPAKISGQPLDVMPSWEEAPYWAQSIVSPCLIAVVVWTTSKLTHKLISLQLWPTTGSSPDGYARIQDMVEVYLLQFTMGLTQTYACTLNFS